MATRRADEQIVISVSVLADRDDYVLLCRVNKRPPEFRIDPERNDRGALSCECIVVDREFPVRGAEEERMI